MLPRLRAEGELSSIQQGHAFIERPLEGKDRTAYVTQLQRLASGVKQAGRPMGKGDLVTIQSMGIPVRRVGAAAEGKKRKGR